MKSILYHNYEPNADLTDTSDDITCFLDKIKYTIGNNILLVGDIGNLGNRLRMLGVSVTILENTCYEDICYSLIKNVNCNVVKGSLEFLPFEDKNLKNIKVKLKNLKHKLCGENINYHYPNEIIDLFSKVNIKGIMKEIENERYIYIGKRNR